LVTNSQQSPGTGADVVADVLQATNVGPISALRRSAAKLSVKTEFQCRNGHSLNSGRSATLSLEEILKNTLRAKFKRGSLFGVASVGATALLLTGCGAAPETGGTATEAASDYTGCIVSDSG
jgi:hypothetical protein